MRIKNYIFILILFFCCPQYGNGQTENEPILLSLKDCIQIAQTQSPSANIVKNTFNNRYWNYRSFGANFLPQISLNVNAPGLVRGIKSVEQNDGTAQFITQSRAFSSMALSIAQNIPLTGGELSVSSGINRIDLFGDTDTFFWQSTPLVVGITQPLFQFNPIRWNRRLEPLRYEIAQKQYMEDMENIAVDITGKFFDLYIAQINLENAAINVESNDTIFTISKGRYNVGKIAENDLLQSELALMNARTQLSNARLQYDRTEQNLRIALGINKESKIKLIAPVNITRMSIDPEFAVYQAKKNRSNLPGYELQKLEVERNLSQAKSNSRLSTIMTASFGYNQSAENVPDLYRDPLGQQSFSVNFQIPIVQWGKGKAEIEATIAEQKRVEYIVALGEENFVQEVYFQILDFLQLQTQVELSARADTIAIRRFEVAKDRYLIGKIDITNMNIAQIEKDNARRSYIQTLRNYWVAFYQLRRLTLYDFESNTALISDPGQK